MVEVLVGAGFPVKECCEVLGVSSAGYDLAKTRPMSPTMSRREWLTGLIREVHADSLGPYGSRRAHGELAKGRGVHVSRELVTILRHDATIAGIPGPRTVTREGHPDVGRSRPAQGRAVVARRAVGHGHHGTPRVKARSTAVACSTRAVDASWAGPLTRSKTPNLS